MNKKVLIVAYYFPPMGLGGVQRMHKLAKYLPRFGYDVHVLTVKPVAYPAYDDSLLDELPSEVTVHRSGSIDPTRIAHILRLPFRPSSKMKSIAKNKGGMWPDSKIGWRSIAIRLGKKIIEEHNIDLILSSSPPVTGHVVAMELADTFRIPWVADFRDIWESVSPTDLYFDKATIERSHILLAQIGRSAKAVTSINDTIGKQISSTSVTIPGGFDEEDFKDIEPTSEDETYTFCYLGSIGHLHPIEHTFKVFSMAVKKNESFRKKARLHIIGKNDRDCLDQLAIEHGIQEQVKITGYLPHKEAIREASESSAFLLTIPYGYDDILTGKIFDYLAMDKPILAIIPPEGEAAAMIRKHNAGIVVPAYSPDSIIDAMLELCEYRLKATRTNIEQATRKYTAKQFAEIFDRLIDG